MTREKALGWARMLASIGDPQTTIEQITCVILATEAQTAARCAEILQRGIGANRLLPPGIRNETGVAEIARNEIIREFPIVDPPGANATPRIKESASHPPSVALGAQESAPLAISDSVMELRAALERVLPMVRACKNEHFSDLRGNEDTRTAALQNALYMLAEAAKVAGCERTDARHYYKAISEAIRVLSEHFFSVDPQGDLPSAVGAPATLAQCVESVLAQHRTAEAQLSALILAGEPFERAVRNIERQEPFWVMLTSQNIRALAAALAKAREAKL